jgi:hypothetical protein
MANITGTFARRLAQEFPTWQVLLCEFVLGSHHFWYYLLFMDYTGEHVNILFKLVRG